MNIDIDVDDILFEMSKKEKQKIFNTLLDENYTYTGNESKRTPRNRSKTSIDECEFIDSIIKLEKNYYLLDNEFIELLKQTAKKF